MCNYGIHKYKPHYVCFECRKTFKRRLLSDIKGDSFSFTKEEVPSKCPECGALMADMGLSFEAPKKNDNKAWKHIRELFESGVTFHLCGCSGPGYVPKDRVMLIEFLENRKEEYIKQRKFWSDRIEPRNKAEKINDWHKNMQHIFEIPSDLKKGNPRNLDIDKEKAIDFWVAKIQEIEQRIKHLKSSI